MPARPPKSAAVRLQSSLRIIGGRWRGRRIEFSAEPGLRPTPDRVRETLFNWLQGYLEGSCCLDLFAGSGALSLEALSRGASLVTAVDQSAPALKAIQANLHRFGGEGAEFIRADVLSWLRSARGQYHIAFIDAPFASGLVTPCIHGLDHAGLLAPGALVYIEQAANLAAPEVPAGWTLHREKKAGGVGFRLYTVV